MLTLLLTVFAFFHLYIPMIDSESYGCRQHTKINWCFSREDCIRENRVIFEDNCLWKCPEWTHFFDEHTSTCYAECPLDTVVSGSSCLSLATCFSKNQLFYNRTCVTLCPNHSPYTRNGKCYSQCPANSVSNGTRCIDTASCTKHGYHIFNTTCLKSCPRNTSFVKYGTCLDTCPPDTVRNGKSCIYNVDCIMLHKVVHNGTCLDMCPAEAPYNVSGECNAHCPQGYVLNDMLCISNSDCTKNKMNVIFNGTCVPKCPDEAPLLNNGDKTCFNKCPEQSVKYGSRCISAKACTDITRYYKLIFNGTCVETCPKSASIMHDRHCLSKCPDYFVLNGTKCISEYECESKGIAYGGKCLKSCPSEAPIRALSNSVHCVKSCPGNTVNEDNKCIYAYSCTSNRKLLFNGTCINECPREAPYQNRDQCVESCPDNTVNEDNKCIDTYSCTDNKKLIFNGTCINECPMEAPYQNRDQCLVKCSSDSYFQFGTTHYTTYYGNHIVTVGYLVGVNGTKCIDLAKCAADGQAVYNQTCVSKCPSGTSTCPILNYPWNHICYPLNPMLFLAFFLQSLFLVILLLYNPTPAVKEGDVPPKEVKDVEEEADSSLDTVVVETEMDPEEQHRVNVENDEDFEDEAPVFYQPNHRLGSEKTTNVEVHNDFPLYDDDIPLLPMDGSNFGHISDNGDDDDDDDALLFGSGHGYGN